MRKFAIILLAAITVILAGGCSKMKNVRVTSCKLESVSPSGLRSLDARLGIGIENPGREFTISGIGGRIYYRGDALADFTADSVTVEKGFSGQCSVAVSATLTEGVSMLSLLGTARGFDRKLVTVDVEALVRSGALKRRYRQEGISLDRIADAVNSLGKR